MATTPPRGCRGFFCLLLAGFFAGALPSSAQTLNWINVTATGVPRPGATTRPVYVYLTAAGDIYLDDFTVSAVTNGINVCTNGGFESGSLSPWIIGSDGNNSASVVSTNFT